MDKECHNEKWECYMCGKEYVLEFIPGGWLGNYHPLCDSCSDSVLSDNTSQFYKAMTFHYSTGDF
jgi:hypothetical protein